MSAYSTLAQSPAHRISAPQLQAARSLEQEGRFVEAEAVWRAYSKAHPANPEPYAQLGLLKSRQEKYAEAVPLYRQALSLNPNFSGLRLNLALALFKSGQLREAIPNFAALLTAVRPNSPEAQRYEILLGMCHYGLAEYSAAVPFLKSATAHDRQNSSLLLALAHSCLWSKQYQCVMDSYHQILTLNSESAEADMLAGEALDEMKDNEGAISMFRMAVKANPKEPNAHFGLAYLLWTQRRYLEAVAEFRAELANDPNHAQSTLYLGDALVQLNEPDDAKPILERAAKLDPTSSLAQLDLGIIDSNAGRNEYALRELQLAEKLQPNDVNAHWRLGHLYRTLGRKEDAKAEFDRASSLNKAADQDLYEKIANARKPTE